jgi:hypothetical protein
MKMALMRRRMSAKSRGSSLTRLAIGVAAIVHSNCVDASGAER